MSSSATMFEESRSSRSIATTLDECRTRIQTIAELLLLSCSPRPVFCDPADLRPPDAYVTFRDKVMGQLNKVLLLTRDIATQVHGAHIQYKTLCSCVREMTSAVITLCELSAHIAYLMTLTFPSTTPATPGPVTSVHQLTAADLDLRFCCARLKKSRMTDLHPNVLVEMCSSISRSITIMSGVCRRAAEAVTDSNDQDQFKLCVKTITSTTGCLVSSIKSFKTNSTETHLRRVMTFCDPVTSASTALLTFATESTFTGHAATLPKEAMELYKSVIGLSMSISSATVQICKSLRDLHYSQSSTSSSSRRQRISLCVESVSRSTSGLRDFLLAYQYQGFHQSGDSQDFHSHTYHARDTQGCRASRSPGSRGSLSAGDKRSKDSSAWRRVASLNKENDNNAPMETSIQQTSSKSLDVTATNTHMTSKDNNCRDYTSSNTGEVHSRHSDVSEDDSGISEVPFRIVDVEPQSDVAHHVEGKCEAFLPEKEELEIPGCPSKSSPPADKVLPPISVATEVTKKLSPSSSISRPTSAVIDTLFCCEETTYVDGYSAAASCPEDCGDLISSTTSLSSVSQSGEHEVALSSEPEHLKDISDRSSFCESDTRSCESDPAIMKSSL